MNRSSGITIFSSAFTICILAIACLLQVKYDVGSLQNGPLVIPRVQIQLGERPEPVQYVVMNPLQEDFPIRLERTPAGPNILFATLPAESDAVVGGQSDTAEISIRLVRKPAPPNILIATLPAEADPEKTRQQVQSRVEQREAVREPVAWGGEIHPWNLLISLGEELARRGAPATVDPSLYQPVSLATPIVPGINNSRGQLELPTEAVSGALEPHLLVVSDYVGQKQLLEELFSLSGCGFEESAIEPVRNQLLEISDRGVLDASLLEGSLYRILDQLERLHGDRQDPENLRLLESVKSVIRRKVNHWIDQLNGLQDSEATDLPRQDLDFQKIHTAIRSLLEKRLF